MAVKWADYDLHDKAQEKAGKPIIRERLWGYFRDRDRAIQAVMENWGANFDEAGYYDGAIIEEVAEGYFESQHDQRWFYRRAAGEEWKMEEIPEPVWFKQVCGLTMG